MELNARHERKKLLERFSKEQIVLVSEVDPVITKLLARQRLTKAAIDSLFSTDVEFLQHTITNQVLFQSDWKSRCLKTPAKYIVCARQSIRDYPRNDALSTFNSSSKGDAANRRQHSYCGDATLIAINVHVDITDEDFLKWLRFGLFSATRAELLDGDGVSKMETHLERRKTKLLNRIKEKASDVQKQKKVDLKWSMIDAEQITISTANLTSVLVADEKYRALEIIVETEATARRILSFTNWPQIL